jgi:hypothetical protein
MKMKMRMHHEHCGYVGRGIFRYLFGIAFLSLILGYPIMLLWNWLAGGMFGAPLIVYWQGVGLFLLGHLIMGPVFPPRPPYRYREMCFDDDENFGHHRWHKWKYYGEYWKNEGKAAFEGYIKRCEEERKKDDKDDAGVK